MLVILISGYTASELGIFSDKDIKISIIKKAIKRELINLLDNGVEWFIFTGKLGFEYWVLEILDSLKNDYDFKLGTLFCFEDYGKNWNESNQHKLAKFKNVDFIKYFYPTYVSPQQLKKYQEFCIRHVDGAFIFYDEENETNFKYFYRQMRLELHGTIRKIDFDKLNEYMIDED